MLREATRDIWILHEGDDPGVLQVVQSLHQPDHRVYGNGRGELTCNLAAWLTRKVEIAEVEEQLQQAKVNHEATWLTSE
jgi:hypothetical protein